MTVIANLAFWFILEIATDIKKFDIYTHIYSDNIASVN